MPRRPREHQIEELSRRAFRDRLPESWVARDLNPDYGLDLSIDIFKEERATGLSFAVQLRATERDNLDNALRSAVRFRSETGAFYRAQANPVLVVLFHVPTGRIFARWFHRFDPHYTESRTGRSDAPSTFAFPLARDDEWTEETPSLLVADVRLFRHFRSPELALPIRFHVVLGAGEGAVHGTTLAEHGFTLRQCASEVADLLVITTEPPTPGQPTINLWTDRTVVDVGVTTTTVHYDSEVPADNQTISNDALLGVALTLDQVGQANLAAQVAATTAQGSSIIGNPEVAFRLAGCMFRSRRIREALQLSDALDSSDVEDVRASAVVLLGPTLAGRADLSDREWQEGEAVLRRRIERRERAGDFRSAASDYYNLGNHFKSARRGREAFSNYRKAAQLRPDYLEREYFNGELGGVLFELGRFRLSAHHYGRAIELGTGGMAHALHADALLWCGRFEEADGALARYFTEEERSHAEWRLKRLLLSQLRESIGDSQERVPAEADSLAILREDDSLESARARLVRAIALDGLCGEAWFLLGVLHADDPDTAFPLALSGALLHRNLPVPWQNAIVFCTVSEAHRSHLGDVIEAAYFLNGHSIVEGILEFVRERDEDFDADGFLRIVEEAVRSVDSEQASEGFEIRILGDGSDHESFRFSPSEPDLDS